MFFIVSDFICLNLVLGELSVSRRGTLEDSAM